MPTVSLHVLQASAASQQAPPSKAETSECACSRMMLSATLFTRTISCWSATITARRGGKGVSSRRSTLYSSEDHRV